MTETLWPPDLISPAIDRLTGIIGQLQITLIAAQQRADVERDQASQVRADIAAQIYPVSVPAQAGTVNASGGLLIASEPVLGPRTGFLWDIRRVSLFGLASSSESVSLWKVGSATQTSAQAQNFVCTLTGPTAFQPFGLGQVMLRASESLMITGTGLTVGETVTLSADGFSITSEWAGLYLL